MSTVKTHTILPRGLELNTDKTISDTTYNLPIYTYFNYTQYNLNSFLNIDW